MRKTKQSLNPLTLTFACTEIESNHGHKLKPTLRNVTKMKYTEGWQKSANFNATEYTSKSFFMVIIPEVSALFLDTNNSLPLRRCVVLEMCLWLCEFRTSTPLTHMCLVFVQQGRKKHKTIRHNQLDRFSVPGKKSGAAQTKKIITLWKHTKYNRWPCHLPQLRSHLLTRPLTSWDELIFFYLCAPSHVLSLSLSTSSFLWTLSCLLNGTWHVNQLLWHHPALPVEPSLLSFVQEKSEVCRVA